MKNFAYSRAGDAPTALGLISQPHTKFLAGGTNLVDLMRENIEQPDTVVDITGLPFTQIEELPGGGLSIGATVRNTAVAVHRLSASAIRFCRRRSCSAPRDRFATWQPSAAI